MIYLFLTLVCATLLGYATPFVNLLAPYFFYAAVSKDNFKLKENPVRFSLLLFTIWLLAVTLYYNNILGLLAGVFAILPTVFLFFYAVQILDKEKALQLLKILVTLSLVVAPVAFYQQYILKVSIFERAYATFGNANFYASYLLMIIPCAAALAINATKKREKLLFMLTALINIYALALTDSRTAITALFISFLFFALLAKNYRLLTVTAVATIALAAAVFIKPDLIPRYNIIVEEFQERITIWSLGWYAVLQHPLTGTGLTSFYTQYVMNYPGKFAPHAHNLFLNIWVEGGLIALSLLLWNLQKVYQASLRKLRGNKNILVIGILVGLTGALIQSFLDNPLENFQTGTLFGFLVAILLRL